jgi:hypothetical protein
LKIRSFAPFPEAAEAIPLVTIVAEGVMESNGGHAMQKEEKEESRSEICAQEQNA